MNDRLEKHILRDLLKKKDLSDSHINGSRYYPKELAINHFLQCFMAKNFSQKLLEILSF